MAGPSAGAGKAKPVDNGAARAKRLTGGGVESASPSLLFAAQVLIGHTVEVQVKDGTTYDGIFHAADVSKEGALSVTLKMATKKLGPGGRAIDMKELAVKPEPLLSIDGKDLMQVSAKGVRMDAGSVGPDQDDMGFGTDAAISRDRGGAGMIGRELEKWVPDAGEGMSLEDMSLSGGGGGSAGGGWDQFATNQSMYGVHTTYDENLYTTKLDKVSSKISEAEAARIAREIERGLTNSTNRHMAEERGYVDDSGEMDEEDKYSSVIRKDDAKPKKPSRPAWSSAGAGVDVIKGALGIKSDGDGKSDGGAAAGGSEAKPEVAEKEAEKKEEEVTKAPVVAEEGAAEALQAEDKGTAAKPSSVAEKKGADEESSSGEGKKEGEAKPAPAKSTLNPNAKSFTFNPNAKEFVPSFGGGGGAARAASSTSAATSSSGGGSGGGGHNKGGGYYSERRGGGGGGGGGNWGGGGGGQMMHGVPNMGGWMPQMGGPPGGWSGGGPGGPPGGGYPVSSGMMNMGGGGGGIYGMPPRGFPMPYYPQSGYPMHPGYPPPGVPMMPVPMGGANGVGRPYGGGSSGDPPAGDSV